jgi:hypothetical protein
MKYLKKYTIFLEEDEFEVKDTDQADVKMAKEKMNTIKEQFNEYNEKKSLIDQVYIKTDKKKTNEEIESELKQILGDTDIQSEEDRNPFLVEYSTIARLKKDVDDLQTAKAEDKVRLDDFREELNLSSESSTKLLVNTKIQDINIRIGEKSTKITQIMSDINTKQKEHVAKMEKIKMDMEGYIKKISDSDQK